MVLGFPANDFGEEEPGTNAEVAKFCATNYGVTFPMFEKTHVVGEEINPLYRRLKDLTGNEPKWNFHKYVVSRDGKEISCFNSDVEPDDTALVRRIEELL